MPLGWTRQTHLEKSIIFTRFVTQYLIPGYLAVIWYSKNNDILVEQILCIKKISPLLKNLNSVSCNILIRHEGPFCYNAERANVYMNWSKELAEIFDGSRLGWEATLPLYRIVFFDAPQLYSGLFSSFQSRDIYTSVECVFKSFFMCVQCFLRRRTFSITLVNKWKGLKTVIA